MTDMQTTDNPLDLPVIGDSPVSHATAIASVALSMALKWVDTTVVKDGTMYQQLKLEQKKIEPVSLDELFNVATQFEKYLMEAPNRLSDMMMAAVKEAVAMGLDMDYPAHPGTIINDELLPRLPELSRSEIAGRIEMPLEEFEELLQGSRDLTIEVSEKISELFNYPNHILIGMQDAYTTAAEKRREATEEGPDHG